MDLAKLYTDSGTKLVRCKVEGKLSRLGECPCPQRRAIPGHPGHLLPWDKLKYHVNGTIAISNMPRQILPRDRKLSRDNLLSRVHVNRVLRNKAYHN